MRVSCPFLNYFLRNIFKKTDKILHKMLKRTAKIGL